MEKDSVIRVEGLTKKYNLYARPQDRFIEAVGLRKKTLHSDFYALNGISFDVKRGETVGIVGTNGSGKSTLLKIITGVLKPTEGTVSVDGRISALLELGAGFNQEYTGLENIYLNGRMMGYSRKEMESRIQDIIDFAEIGEFIRQPVKTYSSGMFARLAFAVAINVEPDILIVDEALSVGDLFFQNKCFKKFEELKSKNVTILFVSHDIASVRQMCSRVIWIEKGIQKIFDKSDIVCDMYMDMKRQNMNENVVLHSENTETITGRPVTGNIKIPPISYKDGKLKSDEFDILSAFFEDAKGNIVSELAVDTEVSMHVLIKLNRDMGNLIVGFVLENSKGLPLYDINNYINQQQVVAGKKDQILEVVYQHKLPRLMKGVYVVSVAVAQGTQSEHIMKTWLHGVGEVEIINTGFNSSYIEVPSDISVNYYCPEQIDYI